MDQTRDEGLVDLDQFERIMGGSASPLEVFLKGHLWIETILNGFIESAAPNASLLQLDRMHFATKVNLCEAFGLLPAEAASAFRGINMRRNALAHDLTAALDEDAVTALFAESSPHIRAGHAAAVATLPPDQAQSVVHRLITWFMVLVMDAGYGLLSYRHRKENEPQYAAYAAIRVVEEMYGTDPMSEEEARKRAGLADPPHPRDVWFRSSQRAQASAQGDGATEPRS